MVTLSAHPVGHDSHAGRCASLRADLLPTWCGGQLVPLVAKLSSRCAHNWKDYRSAKELAKSWFRMPSAAPPEELVRFLQYSLSASEVVLTEAYPECVITLDSFAW
jgi:hypothetical protein